ncbi:MAG: GNAT family N-acetyltransferase [Chloroflexi bacterium]|nr:GNAT family N-acetyltransferase [Chloroflexota bacterium]
MSEFSEHSVMPDEFPTLEADHLVLREITPDDAGDWHAYLSDPRVYEYTSTPVMSVAEVSELIQWFADGFRKKKRIRWALAESENGRMIGDLGYNEFWPRDRRATVGYGLAPEYWGRGLMTEALGTVIGYGFAELRLNKIEATTNVQNERSAALLRRLGFQLEGTLREHRNRRGVVGDAWFFGLLVREWVSPARDQIRSERDG